MVLLQMNPQTGRQQRESFTKPKWKNYDFTMFWSRITTSHGIAVKWYLRIYWLLPLSIVASFKKNRRFFCLAPSILLPSTDDSFGKHHEYLGQSINFISQRSRFLLSTDSFSFINWNSRQLGRSHTASTDTANKTLLFFCWQNGHIGHAELWWFVGSCQDMCLLWENGHQWNGVSPLADALQEGKR